MNFILRRIMVPKYFGGLIIGIIVVLVHVIVAMLPLLPQLDGNNYWFSTYSQWISFDSNTWTVIFFWTLPIISAIGTNQIIHDDISSGFLWQQISKQGTTKYIWSTMPTIFVSGCLTALIPLSINLFFAWTLFPTLKPDLILNFNVAVLPQSTFMATSYYTNPANIVLLYLLLPTLLGGLFALVSGALTLYWNNQFMTITAGFILSLLLTILTTVFPHQVFSPVLIVAGVGFGYVPALLNYLLIEMIVAGITVLAFTLGVKKLAYV